jgi:hypothetical protein
MGARLRVFLTHEQDQTLLHKWQKFGLESLWDKPARGGKTKYSEENIVYCVP